MKYLNIFKMSYNMFSLLYALISAKSFNSRKKYYLFYFSKVSKSYSLLEKTAGAVATQNKVLVRGVEPKECVAL